MPQGEDEERGRMIAGGDSQAADQSPSGAGATCQTHASSEPTPAGYADAILRANQIAYSQLEHCHDGNLNQVFIVDSKYVVRFSGDAIGSERLEAEARLIHHLREVVPIREVIKCGKLGRNAYQILSYVEGVNLADCWASLDWKQKDHLVAELVGFMRALHSVRFDDFGYLCLPETGHYSYRDFRLSEFKRIVDEISNDPAINAPAGPLRTYLEFFSDKSACFKQQEEASLVHNDLWLGNVLVHDNKIVGIIDFELAVKAPIDAELFKIDCFCARPEIFSKSGNYVDFMPLLQKHYPGLFEAARDLRRRVGLHELISVWKGYLFETRTGMVEPKVYSEHLVRMSDDIVAEKTVRLF